MYLVIYLVTVFSVFRSAKMASIETAPNFLDTLNKAHSSVKFTMETECNGIIPFLGIQLLNRSPQIETKVYVKPTNSGLLLHYQSHVGNRYEKGLLRTMLDRAHRLSSSWTHFPDECDRLKQVFSRLKYPKHLVNSTIKSFVDSKVCDSSSLYHDLKRQMTRFEWFYHLKTKSQQIF